MATRSLRLYPGKIVVFEGLDKAGKSTQLELLKTRVEEQCAYFAHMPSGCTAFSQDLYRVLENEAPSSSLARQLTHLACHCENMPKLTRAIESRALVLDRWWWSTMAYGWYGGDVQQAGISEATFRELIARIWAPITASMVFLFLTPHEEDSNNVVGVAQGYRRLGADQPRITVTVPTMSPTDTHEYIVTELRRAGIAEAPGARGGADLGRSPAGGGVRADCPQRDVQVARRHFRAPRVGVGWPDRRSRSGPAR